jgi:CheY-like chemotaxis protein
MSSTHYCNRCLSANPAGQPHCGSCGARLVGLRGSRKSQDSAIWLDAPPLEQDTVPGPLEVTLRNVDHPLPPPPPPPAPAPPELVGHPDDKPVSSPHAATRAERRAAVRRALLRAQHAGSDSPVDVLIYDPDDDARQRIGVWLSAFGFTLHSVPTVAEAWDVAATRRLAAAFLDVAFDDSDGGTGVALCKRIKAMSRRRGDARLTLMVLVSCRLSPVGQVAAQLAGCDECLVKPVTRGAVASVLDKHGVRMPLDSRRV